MFTVILNELLYILSNLRVSVDTYILVTYWPEKFAILGASYGFTTVALLVTLLQHMITSFTNSRIPVNGLHSVNIDIHLSLRDMVHYHLPFGVSRSMVIR